MMAFNRQIQSWCIRDDKYRGVSLNDIYKLARIT